MTKEANPPPSVSVHGRDFFSLDSTESGVGNPAQGVSDHLAENASTGATPPTYPSGAHQSAARSNAPQPAAATAAALSGDQRLRGRLREDVLLFIGPNAAKFIPIHDEREGEDIFLRPCWPGFFLPLPWFLYRKMYVCAASCFIPVLAGLHAPLLLTIILLWLPSLLGGTGRWLYVVAARKKIAEIRDRIPDDEEARAVIAMAGGVSVAGAVLGVTITVLGALIVGIQGRGPFH